MRLGLHALGIGHGARRAVIDAVAMAAEASGFAALWPNFLALLLFTVVLVSLSVWRFRKQLS